VPTGLPDSQVVSRVPKVAEFHQEKIILKNDMARSRIRRDYRT
jgi:hypothetical protein